MAVTMKRNDTQPPLKATLKNSDGSAVPLAGATIKFIMVPTSGTSVAKVNSAAVIVDETTALVEYRWATGDTDTAGGFKGEFEITFADGSIMTVPTASYIPIAIIADLG